MGNISATGLRHTTVYRCGRTAKTLNFETTTVRLDAYGAPTSGSDAPPMIRFFFMMDSKGGGKTRVFLDIKEGDFVHLVGAMVGASPSASLPAMAAAVSAHLAEQPKHEARTRTAAWDAMVVKARKEFDSAPQDRNDVERLILKAVAKLANALREDETTQEKEVEDAAEEE